MSPLYLGTIGKNYTQWDNMLLVPVGAIIAIQSVALSQFRIQYSSEKYTPKWYQRLFFELPFRKSALCISYNLHSDDHPF